MKLTERDKTFIREEISRVVEAINKLIEEVKSLNVARKE